MADTNVLQRTNLYAMCGAKPEAVLKDTGKSKETGEFKELLKDKSSGSSKEPVGKAEKDVPAENVVKTENNQETELEATGAPEQMAELFAMVNVVQESIAIQPEEGIQKGEVSVESLPEEMFSVQSDELSTDILQQEFTSEKAADVESQLKSETADVTSMADQMKSMAMENERKPVQDKTEQKVAGTEQEIHTALQEGMQSEPNVRQDSIASIQTPKHLDVPGEKSAADAKLTTTESTLPVDVAKTIAEKMSGKNGMLTLELEPASLGKLVIQMVHEEGKTVISLMTANARTLELLGQKSAEIAAILEDRTGETTEIQMYEPQKSDNYADAQKQKEDRQEEGQRQHKKQENSASFLQQLRLGLI